MFTDDPLPGYQTYDKALDVYYLAIAYMATMRNWRDPVAFRTSRFLYLYRLVGVTLFELLGWRWLLLVFPNTFEYFFIAYEFVRTRWNPARLGAVAVVGLAAFIWIVIKLPQEWWIHVAQLDFTDFMADHPWMWLVLGGRRRRRRRGPLRRAAAHPTARLALHRRRRPPPDRPAGAGRPGTVLVAGAAREGRPAGPDLGDLLPGAARHPRQQRSGSRSASRCSSSPTPRSARLLRRRGRSWATTAGQFGAMLLINVALVTVDALVGVRRGDRSPAGNTLFFVLLLSLLIALYDRFRATRDPEVDRQRVWPAFRAERAARGSSRRLRRREHGPAAGARSADRPASGGRVVGRGQPRVLGRVDAGGEAVGRVASAGERGELLRPGPRRAPRTPRPARRGCGRGAGWRPGGRRRGPARLRRPRRRGSSSRAAPGRRSRRRGTGVPCARRTARRSPGRAACARPGACRRRRGR